MKLTPIHEHTSISSSTIFWHGKVELWNIWLNDSKARMTHHTPKTSSNIIPVITYLNWSS
nr:hypothetical protein Iba_chr06bCG7540 [Ipomoea batatas]